MKYLDKEPFSFGWNKNYEKGFERIFKSEHCTCKEYKILNNPILHDCYCEYCGKRIHEDRLPK